MLRAAVGVVFSAFALAQNAPEPEIARAAKSPYDLARYIDSHEKIDWPTLWRALGIKPDLGLSCSSDCVTELIVVENPEQAILIVEAFLQYDVYLRFGKGAAGNWRFGGEYHAWIRGEHPRRHEIYRVGNTRFLRVLRQGPRGSGVDAEVEDWLDLSRTGVQPVFSFTVRGHEDVLGVGISREIDADASATSPTEIELNSTVYFSCPTGDLGRFEFVGVYRRAPGGNFALQEAHAAYPPALIPNQDFKGLSEIGGLSQEIEVKYTLPRLKEIAAGNNDDAKKWLKYLLSRTGDTPEKRALLALMGEK